MTNRIVISPGPPAPTADLIPDVCLGMPIQGEGGLQCARSASIAAAQRDSGHQKQLARAVQAPRVASLGSSLHSIRVPMHLTRVPRG